MNGQHGNGWIESGDVDMNLKLGAFCDVSEVEICGTGGPLRMLSVTAPDTTSTGS